MKSRSLKASQAQERGIADEYRGAVSAASGAFWDRKGDVRTEYFLIEAKHTGKPSFRVAEDVLSKIEREALTESRMWALFVQTSHREVVVMDRDDFHTLAELAGLLVSE